MLRIRSRLARLERKRAGAGPVVIAWRWHDDDYVTVNDTRYTLEEWEQIAGDDAITINLVWDDIGEHDDEFRISG